MTASSRRDGRAPERRATEPVATDDAPGDTVYERYSGFMLGFTLELLRLPFARPIFAQQRQRLVELIEDLDLSIDMPLSQAEFVRCYPSLLPPLAAQIKVTSQVMVDFFTLGHLLLRRVAGQGGRTHADRIIRAEFLAIIEQYGIDRAQVDRRLRRRALRQTRGQEFVYALVSDCYEILTLALLHGPKDPRACFVIMPFAPPFPRYYAQLYRPALRLAGYRPVRAWVGVTDERYLVMVQVLMSLCSAALADVSPVGRARTPNLNVLHEVGLAQAMIRQVALIRRQGRVNMPSNLGGTMMGVYYPRESGWPDEQARDLARLIRLLHTGRPPADYRWLRSRARPDGLAPMPAGRRR